MKAHIQKWGNSLALRIPKAFAAEVGLDDQSLVELTVLDGHLVIAPVTQPELTLDELLAGVTEDNLHGEVDTGPAVGDEIW
jgi:antitoxin MazE